MNAFRLVILQLFLSGIHYQFGTQVTNNIFSKVSSYVDQQKGSQETQKSRKLHSCFMSLKPVSFMDSGRGEAGEKGGWEQRGGIGGGLLIVVPTDFVPRFCKPHHTSYYLLTIVLFNVLFSCYTISPIVVKTMFLLIAISQTPGIVSST